MSRWPLRPLEEVLTPYQAYIHTPELKIYPKLSVKLYGKGVVLDSPVDGSTLKMKKHQIAKSGQVILSEIWGKKGAIGFVPPEGDGALCTSHFFLFGVHRDKLDPQYLQAIFTANFLQDQLDIEAKGTTGYAAVRPKNLLAARIPLPPLPEQQRIVARIESLAAKIEETKKLKNEIEQDEDKLLLGTFYKLTSDSNKKPIKEIAPITRRPVNIDTALSYPEIGIRSFGKGTFHKPNINGWELGSKKLYQVQAGDLLFNNVFAWEGAIAVVQPEDTGRFGSHRFIACVPKEKVITANFLRFYFLTKEGLQKIGLASPGGAGRNRTLGLEKLEAIEVPVPDYENQLWFDKLQSKVEERRKVQSQAILSLNALLPSILDKAFKGEL